MIRESTQHYETHTIHHVKLKVPDHTYRDRPSNLNLSPHECLALKDSPFPSSRDPSHKRAQAREEMRCRMYLLALMFCPRRVWTILVIYKGYDLSVIKSTMEGVFRV